MSGTLRTQMYGTRIESEIEAFHQAGNNGLTIYELADMVDMGYHTVRNDIKNLVRIGKIVDSGRVRDKSGIYCAVGKANVPTVLMHGQNVEFTKIIDQALQGLPTRSIDMTAILRMTLVGIAARAKVGPGEKLDFYPKALKAVLVDSVNRAEAFITAAQSILDDPRYWNEYQLPDMLDVDKYDQEKLIAYTRVLMGEITGESNDGDS